MYSIAAVNVRGDTSHKQKQRQGTDAHSHTCAKEVSYRLSHDTPGSGEKTGKSNAHRRLCNTRSVMLMTYIG